ncbi:hypothetical protein Leryth_012683 [Lithospermum erythrorhizon]|nr:hypothetical protein Leryth_012683 [Lithospermum erythrorhizon]
MIPTKSKSKHHHRSSVAAASSPPNHRSSTSTTAQNDDVIQEEWRAAAISGGTLKRVDPDSGTNGWASPSGDLFLLRGPNFFTTKSKTPSGQYLLQPCGVDWLRSTSKLDHYLSHPQNRIVNALKKSKSKPFIIAINLQIPGKDHHSAIFYFSSPESDPVQPGSLLHRFIQSDDNFRNSRLKLVNRIVKGPWIVKTAVGSHSACLLGKALNCRYHKMQNYLEIDVDIGSSKVASAILHLALGYTSSVTIDMGFVVEAQSEEELPEKLFGAVRVCQMEMGAASFVQTPSVKKVSISSNGKLGGEAGNSQNGDSLKSN